MNGVDNLEKTNMMRIYFGEKVSIFEYIYDFLFRIWDWIVPLRRDI